MGGIRDLTIGEMHVSWLSGQAINTLTMRNPVAEQRLWELSRQSDDVRSAIRSPGEHSSARAFRPATSGVLDGRRRHRVAVGLIGVYSQAKLMFARLVALI